MGIIALAGFSLGIFHLSPYRRIQDGDIAQVLLRQASLAGIGSLALWTGVIFLGRWMGFV